jgi:hypothetical protein
MARSGAECWKQHKMGSLVELFLVCEYGSFFFCVVCCKLTRPEAVWCALALQKSWTVGLMKVGLTLFMAFGNGGIGWGHRRIRGAWRCKLSILCLFFQFCGVGLQVVSILNKYSCEVFCQICGWWEKCPQP